MTAAATGAIAAIDSTAGTEATGATGLGTATAVRLRVLKTSQPVRRNNHGHVAAFRRSTPAVLPPPQKLSVLGRQRAEDRLQGRQAAATVRIRARQDRSKPHHGGFRKEATRARPSDQARAVSRAAALRDPLSRGDPTWK